MKLLDLQTGKYLEIGYDWGYYGTHISLKSEQQEAILRHLKIKRDCMNDLCNPNEYSMQYKLALSVKEDTDDRLLKVADVLIEQGTINTQPHTNPIINQIAEKVGAVIYGGRYVLLHCDTWTTEHKVSVELMNGHIFRRKLKHLKYDEDTPMFVIDQKALQMFSAIKDDYITYSLKTLPYYSNEFLSTTLLKSRFKGNIFEEFAKKEQGLKNRFDELYKLI